MHVNVQVVSNMLCEEGTCWSHEVWRLRSLTDTMWDLYGNHTRQLIVICDYESSSPHPKAGWDSEKHVPVWRIVSTLA